MVRRSSSSRESRFARAVLTQNLQVKPGENVIIEGWSHSLPWSIALAREARRLKAFPLVLFEDEESYWDSIGAHEDAILGATPAHEWAALGKTNVYIHMWGAGDKLRLSSLPEDRTDKIFGWNPAWYKAAAKAGLRGSRLEVGRPFPTLAKVYRADLSKWMDQVVDATMVDPDRLESVGRPIVKALEKGRQIRIHDDEGTDVTLGLAQRKVVTDFGRIAKEDRKRPFRMLNVLPAGAIRVALDETVAEGTIVANRASYSDIAMATGGRFDFRNGRLARHSFDEGGEMFDKPYRQGGKGRDRPGYISIGLNPKLHNTPQLEDREAGAILVTVGSNRFFPGGKNLSKFSGFVVNAGATLEIDGKRIALPG